MTIHKRIKELREQKGLSMEDLAERVGVKWQSVQQWEKGRSAPTRGRLPKVAAALGTTSEFLLYGLNGDPNKLGIGDLSDPAKEVIRAIIKADKAGEPAETFKYILRLLPSEDEPLGRLNP
ncbi:helix-turn-helix domain-containing protein [Burkholderia multivorans]|uniref:helix-turn-helix domain-containing protein n=1 Tax=Burkholderia multivorans TaxID=87883 RepID=UPI001C24C377|nr:helix-turn-helix transcriptional regulator [Burkholderia multivorans]MBU9668879.1 helix-turn-helix domain-containing protein [Burkholderia multivorans]HEF4754615.1 helix-turn-helix transcriptional regulator [Burkholderia multivorans]